MSSITAFKCPVPDCDKFFTVRSNARRHMRTHGVPSSPPDTHVPPPSFNVGFEAPYVAHTHDSGGVLPKLKWVETGPTTQMNMDGLDSPSGSDEVDSTVRRHLKTHGLPPSPPDTHVPPPSFNASFEAPDMAHTHDSGGVLPKLGWVLPSPTTDGLDSPSDTDKVGSRQVPPSPFSVVYPSSTSAKVG
jgi:hypothetical protein